MSKLKPNFQIVLTNLYEKKKESIGNYSKGKKLMRKSTYPTVTVLLCTYNDEQYIGETIISILNQTYQNFEFLIVNDGSTDSTKAVIDSFQDDRIRYLEHPKNEGLEESKNRGIDEAKGKYIAYIDGDDLALPNRLEKQVEYMEAHPNIGLCASAIKRFGKKNFILKPPEKDFELRALSLITTPFPHPSCMIRTAVLRKHQLRYSKDYLAAEDYPFMLSLLEVTEAYCFQTPLLMHRWHEQNTSIVKRELQKTNAQRAVKDAFRILLGMENVTEAEQLLYAEFYRLKYNTKAVALEKLNARILLPENLEERDLKFRKYIKSQLSKTIYELENYPKPILFLKAKWNAVNVIYQIISTNVKRKFSSFFAT